MTTLSEKRGAGRERDRRFEDAAHRILVAATVGAQEIAARYVGNAYLPVMAEMYLAILDTVGTAAEAAAAKAAGYGTWAELDAVVTAKEAEVEMEMAEKSD